MKNIMIQTEKNKYQHECLNCNTNYCLNKAEYICPFCKSKALIIKKPKPVHMV